MKNFLKIENAKTSQIILVILMIILIAPLLLSLPAFIPWLDFSKSGEIGSLIGGVTAPFINGLAALLVFLAFKAQIRANEELRNANDNQIKANQSLRNQEQVNLIMNQLSFLQGENFNLAKILEAVKNRKKFYLKGQEQDEADFYKANQLLDELFYCIAEIELTVNEIEEFLGERTFLYKKLYFLYKVKFKTGFRLLNSSFIDEDKNLNENMSKVLNQISELDNYFSSPNKYDK